MRIPHLVLHLPHACTLCLLHHTQLIFTPLQPINTASVHICAHTSIYADPLSLCIFTISINSIIYLNLVLFGPDRFHSHSIINPDPRAPPLSDKIKKTIKVRLLITKNMSKRVVIKEKKRERYIRGVWNKNSDIK